MGKFQIGQDVELVEIVDKEIVSVQKNLTVKTSDESEVTLNESADVFNARGVDKTSSVTFDILVPAGKANRLWGAINKIV